MLPQNLGVADVELDVQYNNENIRLVARGTGRVFNVTAGITLGTAAPIAIGAMGRTSGVIDEEGEAGRQSGGDILNPDNTPRASRMPRGGTNRRLLQPPTTHMQGGTSKGAVLS